MINMNEFVKAVSALQETKNIPVETIVEALKQCLIMAYREKFFGDDDHKEAMARVEVDEAVGDIHFYGQRIVVDDDTDVFNDVNNILLEEAKKIKKDAKVGDIIENEVNIDDFQRAAVQYIKQNLRQKIREAEKKVIQETFASKVDDIITGVVERVEQRFVLVNLGITTAFMPAKFQIPGETYYPGQQLKVYIKSLAEDNKPNSQIVVSRSDSGLLYRLLEKEIAEIYSGEIKVEKIARIPGERSKVAVYSDTPNIDAAGACIGQRGMRIQSISGQLCNEKIDVIQYYKIPELFIAEALKPAIVTGVIINEEEKSAIAVVANDDFSQAIGKKGQNVTLAARITDYRIDIKTVDDAMALKLVYKPIKTIQLDYAIANNLEIPAEVPAYEEEVYDEFEEIEEVKEVKEVKEVSEPVKASEEPIEASTPAEEVEDILAAMPTPKIKAEHISVVEEPKVEVKPVEQPKPAGKSNKAKKKEEEALAKAKEEEARKNYMPVYTEEELKAIQEEEAAMEEEDKYDEDYDEEDYDEYYD